MPTWSLDGESVASWSVAAIDAMGRIRAIREKARPKHGETFRGVIGCYYFADIARTADVVAENGLLYLSDIVAHVIATGGPVLSVPVRDAEFFGDPARLAACAAEAGRA